MGLARYNYISTFQTPPSISSCIPHRSRCIKTLPPLPWYLWNHFLNRDNGLYTLLSPQSKTSADTDDLPSSTRQILTIFFFLLKNCFDGVIHTATGCATESNPPVSPSSSTKPNTRPPHTKTHITITRNRTTRALLLRL